MEQEKNEEGQPQGDFGNRERENVMMMPRQPNASSISSIIEVRSPSSSLLSLKEGQAFDRTPKDRATGIPSPNTNIIPTNKSQPANNNSATSSPSPTTSTPSLSPQPQPQRQPENQEEDDEGSDEESNTIVLPEGERLLLEPTYFEGVASAYRYKLVILNEELYASAFNFTDDVDVFSFSQVNKKRAAKKEEWPFEAPLHHPQRCDVSLQLFAGKTEIKHCAGCSMWKDLTSKPFLVLTPHGTRCVQFLKQPFILLIFRCCPKFHSYAKQFKLLVTLTSARTGKKYSNIVRILRKKMNSKKRKEPSPSTIPNTLSQEDVQANSLQKLPSQQYQQYQQQYQDYQQYQHQYQQQVLAQHNLYSPRALQNVLKGSSPSQPMTATPPFPLPNAYQSPSPQFSSPSANSSSPSFSHPTNSIANSSNLERISKLPFASSSWESVSNYLDMELTRVKELNQTPQQEKKQQQHSIHNGSGLEPDSNVTN